MFVGLFIVGITFEKRLAWIGESSNVSNCYRDGGMMWADKRPRSVFASPPYRRRLVLLLFVGLDGYLANGKSRSFFSSLSRKKCGLTNVSIPRSQYVLESYITRPMDTQASFIFWKCIWGFAIPFFVWVSSCHIHDISPDYLLISRHIAMAYRNGVWNPRSRWNTLFRVFWRHPSGCFCVGD
jgi:hypothetical protein